jgi:hypothetical protein
VGPDVQFPHGGSGAGVGLGGVHELSNALHARVAAVGRSGPPSDGLLRIRRKARARRRSRAALAGSAGILALAAGVVLVTSDRFHLVPTFTASSGADRSVAGSRPGWNGSGHASEATEGGHLVWPPGTGGKQGLAIGPVGPVTSTPAQAAAAKLPLCAAQSLKTTITTVPTSDSVTYGVVDVVARSACVAVGPPVLTVANQAGTAASSVLILKADRRVAAQLPLVSTWGLTMLLKAGDGYQFQFAWAATGCTRASVSPTPSASAATGSTTYYLGYAVTGTTPTAAVMLSAGCGARVYVTDIYQTGAFPIPKAVVSAPPDSAAPSTAPTSASPSAQPPTTSPANNSPSPVPSGSNQAPSGGVSSAPMTPSG